MFLANLLRLSAFAVLLTTAGVERLMAADEPASEAAVEARLKKYLPRTFPKLQRRARVRVTVVGDSIGNFYLPVGEESLKIRNAWHWKFLEKLGSHFFYAGGVQDGSQKAPEAPVLATLEEMKSFNAESLAPRGQLPALAAGIPGAPEIILENFSRGGATSIHADQVLTTTGFDDNPDLVVWMYGVNDANTGNPVEAYKQALSSAILHCRQHGADLIIAGPSLIYGQDVKTLSLTLPYSRAARELADQGSVLFIDMASALGNVTVPDPVDATNAFPQFLKSLLVRYEHEGASDRLHPNAKGHEVMAEAAWQALSEGQPANQFEPRGSFTLPSEGNQATLEIMIRQPASTMTVEPLPEVTGVVVTALSPPGGWQRVGEPSFPVRAFTDHKLTRMPLEPLPGVTPSLPIGKDTVCGFVIYHEQKAQLVEVPLLVLPFSIEIPSAKIEGVAGDLIIECKVMNRQDQELRAPVQVDWLGKQISLDLAVEAHSEKPLRLRLPLPAVDQLHEALTLHLESSGKKYSFTKMVDGSRNLVPNQKVDLRSEAGKKPQPSFLYKADAHGLYCTVTLPPVPKPTSPTLPSATVYLMLDARAASERGKVGYVDPINIDVPWQDGNIAIKRLRPAVFGSGYDREISGETVRASLRTSADGQRVLQVDIPRNDFYLHEWSLTDKGQNTLGFNVAVSLLDPTITPPDGAFTPENTFQFADGAFSRLDVNGLGVLQLTPKGSGEWTVRIY